jgi:hypothetical protein
LQKVTEKKNSHLSEVEDHNKDCPKTFSATSSMSSEVTENKNSIINKKISSEDILQHCKPQCPLQEPSNMKTGSAQVNMNISVSFHDKKELTARTETAAIKGLSPSVNSPSSCRTKANKILQFSSDGSSEADAEDDLITSSQGDEDSGRKRYVTLLLLDLIYHQHNPYFCLNHCIWWADIY